jgi:hypothetical protein
MQVWVLSDESVYHAFKQSVERVGPQFTTKEEPHSLGFRYLLVSDESQAPLLGLLLVPLSYEVIFQALQSIHKLWQVSDFLIFDVITCLKPELFDGQDYLTAIPKRCLRSAGRGDLQTGPLLYEDMGFSDSVQINLAQTFLADTSSLVDPQLNIFSGFGLDHNAAFEKTISEGVGCFGWDHVSGEVIQSCRRLAVRAGGLYVITPRHEHRLGSLSVFLKANQNAIFGQPRSV